MVINGSHAGDGQSGVRLKGKYLPLVVDKFKKVIAGDGILSSVQVIGLKGRCRYGMITVQLKKLSQVIFYFLQCGIALILDIFKAIDRVIFKQCFPPVIYCGSAIK